jgi:hypothetical protein
MRCIALVLKGLIVHLDYLDDNNLLLQVSMMSTDGTGMTPTPHIKKEEDPATFQACSPSNSNMYSPTTTVLHNDVSTCA